MPCSLPYGKSAHLLLDLPPEAVAFHGSPLGEELPDPAAAVAEVLAQPLDFPPLRACVTPSDHVTIAVAPGVPAAGIVVGQIVRALQQGQVAAENISVLQVASEAALADRDWRSFLPADARSQVQFISHDASQRGLLSFLAASEHGEAIYFSRLLCDADMVVTVGSPRAAGSLGYSGAACGLYPAFADEAAQARYLAALIAVDPRTRQRLEDEAENAAWLLGALFSVQVLPGVQDAWLGILAGQRHAVAARGAELSRPAYTFSASAPASLAIATIDGGSEQQTWESFARALFTASQAVVEGGSLAICSELAVPPGPALQCLAGGEIGRAAVAAVRRQRSPDLPAALQLSQLIESHRIYLLSQLDADVVESLGMAYVAGPEEIARLARRHPSCALLASAQHLVLEA